MTPLLSLVVYMAIVIWASLLAASLIRAEGWTLYGLSRRAQNGRSVSAWVPQLSTPNQNMTTKFRTSIFGKLIKITRLSLFGVLVACGLSTSCSPNVAPVKEAEYSATIVGEWFGTSMVGDTRDSISFSANGSFVAHVRPVGFISNTLGQGQGFTGTIGGTWAIKGKSITLSITSAEDERVLNKSTTSTIETFRPNELIVKSNTEGTSTFIR